MKGTDLICHKRSSLLLVDIQEKLIPVIQNRDQVLANAERLLHGAECFEIPVTLSEQYPKGLGPTDPTLLATNNSQLEVLEKTTFSCREMFPRFEGLKNEGRDQILIAGIEAHICVLQSAIDLATSGFQVFLVADAVGSRAAANRELAIDRCSHSGVIPVSTESILFEWCETSQNKHFKAISKLVR